jgi:hypothetical protein
VTFTLPLIMAPMAYKAGLEGKFGAAFDRGYLMDYLRRVGWLTLGVHLLVNIIVTPLLLVSICVPLIGPYAAVAYIAMFHAHLATQLYLTYLERGGREIVIMPDPVEGGGFEVMRG